MTAQHKNRNKNSKTRNKDMKTIYDPIEYIIDKLSSNGRNALKVYAVAAAAIAIATIAAMLSCASHNSIEEGNTESDTSIVTSSSSSQHEKSSSYSNTEQNRTTLSDIGKSFVGIDTTKMHVFIVEYDSAGNVSRETSMDVLFGRSSKSSDSIHTTETASSETSSDASFDNESSSSHEEAFNSSENSSYKSESTRNPNTFRKTFAIALAAMAAFSVLISVTPFGKRIMAYVKSLYMKIKS